MAKKSEWETVIQENVVTIELVASLKNKEGKGTFMMDVDEGKVEMSHLAAYRKMTPEQIEGLSACLAQLAKAAAGALKKYKTK